MKEVDKEIGRLGYKKEDRDWNIYQRYSHVPLQTVVFFWAAQRGERKLNDGK